MVWVLAAPAQAQSGGIGIVSRERVLREVEVAKELQRSENALTLRLQDQIDTAKASLAEEEAELATLRAEIPAEEFEARAVDFDRRVKLVRRNAQERVSLVQRTFQEARAAIVAALPGVLEKVRVEAGIEIVINADQVLAAPSTLDLTARVVEVFNREGPRPAVPSFDLDAPLLPPATLEPAADPEQNQ